MRTFDEIRHEIAQGKSRNLRKQPSAIRTEAEEERLIAEGNAINNLLSSDGWKLINAWILKRLDIQNILHFQSDELVMYQQNVKAFTDLFGYINGSVALRNNILEERSKKDG